MFEVMPSKADIERLHRKYAPNQRVYDLVYGHCQIVAEIALWCAENVTDTDIDKQLLETAALLHDVGSYAFFDDNGKVLNSRLYPQHAILGARILDDEGIDKRITSIVRGRGPGGGGGFSGGGGRPGGGGGFAGGGGRPGGGGR